MSRDVRVSSRPRCGRRVVLWRRHVKSLDKRAMGAAPDTDVPALAQSGGVAYHQTLRALRLTTAVKGSPVGENSDLAMRSPTVPRETTRGVNLRDEALLMLDKRGTLLDIAREVSHLMRTAAIPGVVIGGVAVVLHGYVRTTKDVDILLPPPLEPLADLLTAHGYTFDRDRREFVKQGVPVQLVLPEQVGELSTAGVEIEGITTVTLADLINMKLRSGSTNLLRAQDLADVIGLIRQHQLPSGFARHLDKALRPTFRRLARQIQRESPGR